MVSRDINDLDPLFKIKVNRIKYKFNEVTANAVTLLVYCTRRSIIEQAILYRQGRSTSQINAKQDKLIEYGFPKLSDVLEDVGPQYETVKVTGAGPGESWHNYNLAIDAVPIQAGNLLWNRNDLYDIYGELAEKQNLTWGASFGDKPHIQMGSGNPLEYFTTLDIRRMLNL